MAAIKALQQWCKQQCEGYRDVSITNMTTSFRDGLAFCAILHKHRPDLINFNSLSKENVYENNHLAFHVAEEKLGIPALLDAEDMVQLRVPDRLSILTYVSQYYNYFHGRSPIGGMGAIKRPPPDTIEEPAGKKVTNVTPPSQPQPAPRSHSAVLKENSAIENPPVRAGIKEIDSNGALSSNCSSCGKHVHLVQRHLADGKLYHRNCFKCKQCSRTLQPGSYKPGYDPGSFICTNHSSTTSPLTFNTPPSGPHRPVTGTNQNSPSFTSSAQQEQTSKTPSNRSVPSLTNAHHQPSNRTAVGFGRDNDGSPSGTTSGQWQGSKVTNNFQKPTSKESLSSANGSVQESTNRTAVGFYNTHKHTPTTVNPAGPGNAKNGAPSQVSTSRANGLPSHVQEQANNPAQAYLQAIKGTTENTNSSLLQPNSAQKEAKKEPVAIGQQTKPPSSTSSPANVSSSLGTKWSSPVSKYEPKEDHSSPKPSLSAAKTKEAREKFFQSTPTVMEPTTKRLPVGRESPKISSSNGPGRSTAMTSTSETSDGKTEKDKARNYLLKTLQGSPKSPSGADKSSSESVPQRNVDFASKTPTPKEDPPRPVPKERLSKAPKAVPSPEPPKSTPTYTVGKGTSTPSTPKTPISMQTGLSSTSTTQKKEEVTPKAPASISKVSTPEGPEDWRSRLKPVDKKPSTPRVSVEKEKSSLKDQDKPSEKKPASVITSVTINVNPSPSGKENKPTQIIAVTPSPAGKTEERAPSTPTPPKKKLLTVNMDLISDLPKPTQKWQDISLSKETEPPSWRSHPRPENAFSTQKPLPTADRSEYIPEEKIQRQLMVIEQELDYLELQGVDLEKQLRSCDGDDTEDALMVDWFKLIHEKQLLLRQESELNYISKTQILESQQADVETELRNIMNKPDHEKSGKEKEREQELLKKLLLIVNDRSEIIECLDEDRIREKAEDEVMEAMIQRHTDTNQKPDSPEPNIKRKSRFSFSGMFRAKDKSNS
ncbi:MICAL-like protein 2 [Pelodytes ibericus]